MLSFHLPDVKKTFHFRWSLSLSLSISISFAKHNRNSIFVLQPIKDFAVDNVNDSWKIIKPRFSVYHDHFNSTHSVDYRENNDVIVLTGVRRSSELKVLSSFDRWSHRHLVDQSEGNASCSMENTLNSDFNTLHTTCLLLLSLPLFTQSHNTGRQRRKKQK